MSVYNNSEAFFTHFFIFQLFSTKFVSAICSRALFFNTPTEMFDLKSIIFFKSVFHLSEMRPSCTGGVQNKCSKSERSWAYKPCKTPGRQAYNHLTFPVVRCTADFLDVHNINLTRVLWWLDQLRQKLAHALWESSFLGLTNLVQMRPHNDEACIGSCGWYGV